MKYIFIALAAVAVAPTGYTEDALLQLSLKGGKSYEVVSGGAAAIYPLSARAKPIVQKSHRRAISAADYQCGVEIKTKDPKVAIQEVMHNLSESSGLSLGTFYNSKTTILEPVMFLMAASEKSVWNIVMTPKDADTYTICFSYLIDE